MLRALAFVAVIGLSSPAAAQSEASTVADAAGLGVLTGLTTASTVWLVAVPWMGFWHDAPTPSDWRSWLSALLTGAAAGITTAFAAPRNDEAVYWQAMTLSISFGVELPFMIARLFMGNCLEICHKLMLAMPLFAGLAASFLVGQLVDAELGTPMMTAPLMVAF
jgi:hypothetical protein